MSPLKRFRRFGFTVGTAMLVCGATDAKQPGGGGGGSACPTKEHLYIFEDSNGVLSDPNNGFVEIRGLMLEAATEVILTHGDEFDFVACFTSFSPQARFAGAFHTIIENDVAGIGLSQFDNKSSLQVPGDRLQSLMMMYDLGSHSNIQNTLYHEFAHRWMAYLPPLSSARPMQSPNSPAHFTCALDAQGGATNEEWTGSGPIRRKSAALNVDTGGRYSYLGLYLAGIVSGAEMDSLMSEQRYLDLAEGDCSSPYNGPVSTWSSADIIATAGTRVPDALASQKDFTVAWIVIHQAGTPPTNKQLNDILGAVQNFAAEWSDTMVGRSTLDHRLFEDANCDGVPDGPIPDCNDNGVLDSQDIAGGLSGDCNGNGVPDECDFNEDCNGNGVLDQCDIASGVSQDVSPQNGRPDECDLISAQTRGAAPAEAFTVGCWLDGGAANEADVNGDGIVDSADLEAFFVIPAGSHRTAEEVLAFLSKWFDTAR